jgi:O-antigen ligase
VAYKESDLVIGSTEQPFFSILSIYTELGVIGLVYVLGTLVVAIRRVQRRVRERPELYPRGLAFVTGTGFFTLIALQDNYWEAPQAMLMGLLLLQVLYATIMFEPAHA